MFIGYEISEAQYFENITSPRDVLISCGDNTSYKLYPDYNWVYNKIALCETQNITAYPHGVMPDFFPTFSKPITNLYGMGEGTRRIFFWNDDLDYMPGHFLMPVLTGIHLSTDFAVIDGITKWNHSFIGHKDNKGEFTYWEHYSNKKYEEIIEKQRSWILKNLKGYTGVVNLESIGNDIIECHLRMSGQFIDLYGPGWLEAVVDLYNSSSWSFNTSVKSGYSIPVWYHTAGHYKVDWNNLDKLRNEVSSVQICFDERQMVSKKSFHKDYFRLAVVNDFDYEKAQKVAEEIKETIILTV